MHKLAIQSIYSLIIVGVIASINPVPAHALTNDALKSRIAYGDRQATHRIARFTKLQVRINAESNINAPNKAVLQTEIAVNIAGLTAAKQRLDTDTTSDAVRIDTETITRTYNAHRYVSLSVRVHKASLAVK